MTEQPQDPATYLDAAAAAFREITGEVRDRFGALTPEQLSWRPGPGRWGVAHCLAHLTTTGDLYAARLVPALQTGREAGRTERGPVRGRWFGRWFARQLGPDQGRPTKTPKVFRPAVEDLDSDPLAEFEAGQARLLDVVERARGLDLDDIRIASPVTALIRFTVTDALRILVVHERRHVLQARRVVETPGFPG